MTMKRITFLLLLLVPIFTFTSCEDDIKGTEDLNYVTFEAVTMNMGVPIDGSTEREIKLYTTQVASSDRSFNINVVAASTTASPGAYSIPATVTVPANSNVGVLTIGLSDVNIGSTGKRIVLAIGAEEGLFRGESVTINITQICTQNEVTLSILFDGYASETTWVLKNSAGATVAQGGGYNDGLASFNTKFCLPNGTYTFTIYDDWGDGLSYPSNGSATLTKGTTQLGRIVGDFGSEASVTFTVTK